MVEVHEILEYAQRLGAQEAEVVADHTTFNYARFERGEPHQALVGDITEYAVRILVHGSMGCAYFTDNWKSSVREALSMAQKGYNDRTRASFNPDTPPVRLHLSHPSVKEVTLDTLISDLTDLSSHIVDERIVATTCTSHAAHSTTEIANTLGLHQSESSTLVSSRVMCRAQDSDYGMGYARAYSLAYDIDFDSLGMKAQEDALNQLGKERPEPGDTPIILSPGVMANLLVCAALPSFLGHNVAEGRSILHLGDSVASDHIRVVENPLIEGPQGRSFDDEGVASQSVDLITDGCVRSFLYDRYYGKSTGSGIRYSRYRGRSLKESPLPCATSLSLYGDASPLEDMISSVDEGLLILDETNSHASKIQSGLFSIAVTSGFKIKKGELCEPVGRCMISGLAFEDLLPHLSCISRERELHRSFVYPTYVDTGYALVDSLRVTA
ncbi:MAG: TldD/PmbA family protein [Theionarchaea archaeon]|nr:TldD/PmbA family protein [Theionarchaea archaeon]